MKICLSVYTLHLHWTRTLNSLSTLSSRDDDEQCHCLVQYIICGPPGNHATLLSSPTFKSRHVLSAAAVHWDACFGWQCQRQLHCSVIMVHDYLPLPRKQKLWVVISHQTRTLRIALYAITIRWATDGWYCRQRSVPARQFACWIEVKITNTNMASILQFFWCH